MTVVGGWSLDGPLTPIEMEEAAILTQLLPTLGQVAPFLGEGLPIAPTHPAYPGVILPPQPEPMPEPSPPSPVALAVAEPQEQELCDQEFRVEDSAAFDEERDVDVGGEARVPSSESPAPFKMASSRNIIVEIPKSTLVVPRSQHEGFLPPLPAAGERIALSALMEALEARREDPAQQEFIEFDLDQFVVYRNKDLEMRTLSLLSTKMGHDRFFFDGILSCGDVRFWVEKVEFSELPIGNYGTMNPSVGDQIWVRSHLNASKEIYYKLGKPAIEYERFHVAFLWIADLAKHAADYSGWLIEEGREVALESFRKDFLEWLLKQHGNHHEFLQWRKQHPSPDFRSSVSVNVDYIWKEMHGVLGTEKASSLRLFREILLFKQYDVTHARPLPPVTRRMEQVAPTIVTPYIKECFEHMVFGNVLHAVGETRVRRVDVSLRQIPPVAQATYVGRRGQHVYLPLKALDKIQVGDTISTPRDGDTTDTRWRAIDAKGMVEDHRWFGFVQKVHVAKDGFRSFDVTWFYRPVDTPCCMMKYPWVNELFFSDHCTCEEAGENRVHETEVLAVHNFDWFVGPEGCSTQADFFVRQMYIVEHRRFVTLDRTRLRCSHQAERPKFKAGDTVLAVVNSTDRFSEPYEVVKYFKQASNMFFFRLRKLLRRHIVDPVSKAAPNELVYTDKDIVVKPDKIVGECAVRFFRAGEDIPTPYNRNGTGNLFYITHRLDVKDGVSAFIPYEQEEEFPASLRQGFHPSRQKVQKLKGLDLFCGAGNLGRGLEDGGAVEMLWANDISVKAMHTYMLNVPDATNPPHPFLGSVDDLLQLALEGKYGDNIPCPGDVDLISGGSPCPGFSLLTNNKDTLAKAKERSLVASFASFIDFYRPKYAILENVPTIVQTSQNRSEDVMSQLFCAIVGLGYQAQLIMGDAWSHGAPQSRTRVFLWVAAPGFKLPEAPALSHSHYPRVRAKGLGTLCTNEAYIRRSFQPTPFKYVGAEEAAGDLPPIWDGKVESCVAYPDHRVASPMTATIRPRVNVIPCHPYGMGVEKAWNKGNGVMKPETLELFLLDRETWEEGRKRLEQTKGWSRIKPTDVFSTVTATISSPGDLRASKTLHWVDGRPLTVMEARRAQGFLDEDVLVGSLADRWRSVGNSVARQMSLTLGLNLREAWVGSVYADRESTGMSRAVSMAVEEDVEMTMPWEESKGSRPRSMSRVSWSPIGTPAVSESAAITNGIAIPSTSDGDGRRKRKLRRGLRRYQNKMQQVENEKKKEMDADMVVDEMVGGVTVLSIPELDVKEPQRPTSPVMSLRGGLTIVRIPDSEEEEE